LEVLKTIKFNNLDYPLLILSFISKASEILGKKILIQFNKSSFLVNFNKSILLKDLNERTSSFSKEVTIKFLENKNTFSGKEWSELYKLSEETFVEESESLRSKGAGAGLTDND